MLTSQTVYCQPNYVILLNFCSYNPRNLTDFKGKRIHSILFCMFGLEAVPWTDTFKNMKDTLKENCKFLVFLQRQYILCLVLEVLWLQSL